jgi:hypothetical protein
VAFRTREVCLIVLTTSKRPALVGGVPSGSGENGWAFGMSSPARDAKGIEVGASVGLEGVKDEQAV